VGAHKPRLQTGVGANALGLTMGNSGLGGVSNNNNSATKAKGKTMDRM